MIPIQIAIEGKLVIKLINPVSIFLIQLEALSNKSPVEFFITANISSDKCILSKLKLFIKF